MAEKLENRIAAVMNRVVARENVKEKVDDWDIFSRDPLGRYIKIGMNHHLKDYENHAEFFFLVARWDMYYDFEFYELREDNPSEKKGSLVSFANYHRLCPKGTGTPSLKQIEAAFARLAEIRNEPVEVVFTPGSQEDTKRWLIKNNYDVKRGVYSKSFKPQKSEPE